MANPSVFTSTARGQSVPKANILNQSGGTAYQFSPEHALAQLAATGTFNKTFYGTATDQLEGIRKAASQCSPEYIAKCALYARQKGYMKDMPAALLCILSTKDTDLLDKVFDRVADNGKMIRNFVQMIRSGAFGRKSLGSGPKRLIKRWFANSTDKTLLRASVGQSPSLADVVKMVHPRPANAERRAFYGWLLGKEHDSQNLPQIVKDFEAFKRGDSTKVPPVDFRQLTAMNLTSEQWTQIARNGGWTQTRMNLNTYARHGVFKDPSVVRELAAKLSDREMIQKARIFPYQLLVAYLSTDSEVPNELREALQDAMEVACENIPQIKGRVLIFPDISGSMGSPVTGYRKGATTKVTCKMAAALIASSFLRTNKNALVLPFHNRVQPVVLNPRDTVITNAEKLNRLPSGGTSCSVPLRHCNEQGENGDLIVYVSDNESWVDSTGAQARGYNRGTATMDEFKKFKQRNPRAKMVCIDMAPYGTTQAPDAPNDVMNIGGFSDNVFETIAKFVNGESIENADASTWVAEIKAIKI